ncbi:prolyl oligopeptidase family serine peptidase [bacterium]|nr:prolyl oligopeptidase family serine peptidase [bacterium]
MRRRILTLGLVATLAVPALAGTLTPERVLTLAPLPLPKPAFHDAESHGASLDDLLERPALDLALIRPHAGETVPTPAGDRTWRATRTPLDLASDDQTAREHWLAIYLRSDRWQEATLALDAPDETMLHAWLGADAVELSDADSGHEGTLELPIGVHRLVVRAVVAAGGDDGELALSLALADDVPDAALAAGVDPRRPTDIHLVLDAPRVQQALISPDGTLVALEVAARPGGGDRERWLEIRDAASGDLVTTWRGLEARDVAWAPDGRRLSYVLRDDDVADIWLHDLDRGTSTALARGLEDLGRHEWAPSGEFLVYQVRVEAEKDERKVKRVKNPADRQPWHRDRSYLGMVAVPGGVHRRLTAGPISPSSWSISPQSDRLLFFLEEQDLAGGRPYFSSELWELDLDDLSAERLLAERWIGDAAYGPDPDTLLLRGSPSAFEGLGRDLPDGVQANDYGGQLYLLDRESGDARWISRDLRPDVASMWWSRDDGLIYALCTDTQFRTVHRTDPGTGAWERVATGVEYTDQFDLARHGRSAVARGTSVTTPNQVFTVDLATNRARLLHDPGADAWQDVAFGEVTYWKAPLPDGEELDGRIYWPVDHDPDERYPVIVYYYGGTSPVTVDFGGRYPKNVWAGQDYIVYVPQPSGATGYGQEFAARHVNDWGERTAWEVIESTRAFLEAHPSADPERVGCIGASYGGFLTMNVITKTDLFAAAVSHAGISSISSYWGEGLWGYAYGARALANAFPWTDRDLYVEQSALFQADRITTPLLLVHGDSDTNVPVGESDQLFTALQLLGREVEYVQIQGQDHWILDHDQRIVWNDTILAFFARYLKGRDGWWNALYPDD